MSFWFYVIIFELLFLLQYTGYIIDFCKIPEKEEKFKQKFRAEDQWKKIEEEIRKERTRDKVMKKMKTVKSKRKVIEIDIDSEESVDMVPKKIMEFEAEDSASVNTSNLAKRDEDKKAKKNVVQEEITEKLHIVADSDRENPKNEDYIAETSPENSIEKEIGKSHPKKFFYILDSMDGLKKVEKEVFKKKVNELKGKVIQKKVQHAINESKIEVLEEKIKHLKDEIDENEITKESEEGRNESTVSKILEDKQSEIDLIDKSFTKIPKQKAETKINDNGEFSLLKETLVGSQIQVSDTVTSKISQKENVEKKIEKLLTRKVGESEFSSGNMDDKEIDLGKINFTF